jgi:N-acetylglucosaminyldiphosphoundecaprenol N-acetyl-beta-D-mannosaminyltransferase
VATLAIDRHEFVKPLPMDMSERVNTSFARHPGRMSKISVMQDGKTVRLLNVDIHDVTMDDLLDLRHGVFLTVHTDMMRLFQFDRGFYDFLGQYDLITCDSQILVYAAKLLGTPFLQRVSGSDYFPKFYSRYADDPSVRIFLCGAQPGVAEIARDKINAKVGRDIVVGTDSPNLASLDDAAEIDRLIDKINASGATVLTLGLPTPKQDRFLHRYRDRMPGIELIQPLGGTIDYEAGHVKRPAPWVTNIGLEWLWRVAIDPKTRWKRYFVEQPPVLWHLTKQRLGRYHNPFEPTSGA